MKPKTITRQVWAVLLANVFTVAMAETTFSTVPVWIDLRFNGEALKSTGHVDISCFSYTENRWLDCQARPNIKEFKTEYTLQLPPGKYRAHVSIDENPANPARFPGDYEAQQEFEVHDGALNQVGIDVPRLIHLVSPGDNGRAMDGVLGACDRQPQFVTPRYAWEPAATIDFAWEPVVTGAQYKYKVFAMRCQPWGEVREVASATTTGTRLTIPLPPNEEGQFYLFRVEAWKDGRFVGDFYTHDSGMHSWNYRFGVLNTSIPHWGYYAAALGVLLLLLLIARLLQRKKRDTRGQRVGARRAIVAISALAAIVSAGLYLHRQHDERRAERKAAEAEAEHEARKHQLRAAFQKAAPRPDWWDSIEAPLRIDSLGALLSFWQTDRGGSEQERKEREFFKAVYQAILDRPDDEHVSAYGIDLLYYVVTDYPHRLSLNEYAFERFLHYRSRTDNCANCMTGDVTHGLALNLGQLYLAANRPADGIAVNERLLATRADISPYKLADTHTLIANGYWARGEREHAIELLRAAVSKYGDTVNGDTLRATLTNYERDMRR